MTATASPLTNHLDAALSCTVQLAPMLRIARAPGKVLDTAEELDLCALKLAEADLCNETGTKLVIDLRAAVALAYILVDGLGDLQGDGLALVLAREEAAAARDALVAALRSSDGRRARRQGL